MSNKLVSIGIDVGSQNGAISVVDEELKILLLTKTPIYQTEIKSRRNKSKLNKETNKFEKDYRKRSWVDYRQVGELLKPFQKCRVIYTLEKATVRPFEGEAPSFMNGNALGIFQGVSLLLNPISYFEPLPAVWKANLGVTSEKETSINLAEKIYEVNLKDYLKTGKRDDIAEALLLSFYGLKQYYIQKGELNG